MFKDGEPRPDNAGRKIGSINKTTRELKELILGALDKAGGLEYLTQQAKANPVAFLGLLGKVLPMQIKADLTSRKIIVHVGLSGTAGHTPTERPVAETIDSLH